MSSGYIKGYLVVSAILVFVGFLTYLGSKDRTPEQAAMGFIVAALTYLTMAFAMIGVDRLVYHHSVKVFHQQCERMGGEVVLTDLCVRKDKAPFVPYISSSDVIEVGQ